MKIFNKIITLGTISSVMGLFIPEGKRIENTVRDDIFANLVKKECQTAVEKLQQENESCTLKIDSNNNNQKDKGSMDELCKTFNTEKCQAYYNTKLSEIPECQSSELGYLEGMDNLTKLSYLSIKLACSTDENNEYCPLSQFGFTKDDQAEKEKEEEKEKEKIEIYEQAKQETCNSKKCRDSYLSIVESVKKEEEEYLKVFVKYVSSDPVQLNEIKTEEFFNIDSRIYETMEYLKTENCTSSSPEDDPSTSNTTSFIRENMNLYVILSIISFIYVIIYLY
ncbi:hypothetical protein H8356DRAFT_1655959 [Neocallimastix lanati (nom. inval.)]|nr:hypothetical protein H8356DRAFT_1655959 [Neocallimastix sp. JGI-2020a]